MGWVTVPRKEIVFLSWYVFAIVGGIVLVYASAICYAALFGITFDSLWSDFSLPMKIGFVVTLLASLLCGMSAGGWFWARIAKRYFGLKRSDAERLLLAGDIRVRFWDRANRRAIDRLFGPDQ